MTRPLPFVLAAFLLAVAPPAEAQAPLCVYHQVGCSPETGNIPELGTPVGTHGTSRVYIADDRVRVVDLETLSVREIPLQPFVHLWDSLTIPLRSMGVGGPDPSAWIWDASGGTPMRLPLREGERAYAYPRRSWYALFGHAPGIRPETGNPVLYGGYGYYRAQDFLLEFDPEADTWRELPARFGSPTPGPRNAAWMLTGWDARRILLLGGSVAQSGQSPPVYSDELRDAWVYDPADSTWSEVDVDPGLVCSLKQWIYTKVSVATHPSTGSVAFPVTCPTAAFPDRTMVQWRPLAGTVDVLGVLPRDLALQQVPLGTYIVPGSDSVTAMFWQVRRGRPPVEWTVHRFRFPLRTGYGPAGAGDGTRPGAWLPWLAGLLLAATAGAIALARRRQRVPEGTVPHRRVIRVEATAGHGAIRLADGVDEHRPELSIHAAELLTFVARRQADAGQVLDAEEVNDLFLSRYRDPDTARVTKNRALDQLNEAFVRLYGMPLLERRRSPVDRRRVEYVIGFALRTGSGQES